MAKKPGTNPKGEFVFFDVVYEDGSQRSNRSRPTFSTGWKRTSPRAVSSSSKIARLPKNPAGHRWQSRASPALVQKRSKRPRERNRWPALLIRALGPHI